MRGRHRQPHQEGARTGAAMQARGGVRASRGSLACYLGPPASFVPCRFPQPLSVELGPGILNNIFDGIQRPLKSIAVASGDCFIPRGVSVPALDANKQWEFHPTGFKVRAARFRGSVQGRGMLAGWLGTGVKEDVRCHACCSAASPHRTTSTCSPGPLMQQVGDRITAGDIYGIVHENSLVEHRIMLPPGAKGTITYIAPAGHYNVNEELIEVDFMGQKKVRQ